MRNLVIGTLVTVLLLSGAWWAVAQPPTPSVPAPTLLPNLITVSRPTQVFVTISIPTPTLNPTSVELYRTGPNGASTLVAQLNDTGKNGDRKPGDKIFSTTLTLYEATPSAFGFQVSATFTGKNKVWGQIQQFVALATTSIPVSLPPDPGEAGKATLQGIDSDADGVRDDVQRYIVFSSPDSERKREALLQSAKASQSALLGSSQKPLAVQAINAYLQGLDCLNYSVSIDEETSLRVSLRSAILNTRDRTIAWMEANRQFSGQKITSKFEPTTLRQACVTDPETLRN